MNINYGWNDYFKQQLDTLYPGLDAARVIEVHGETFLVALQQNIIEVPLSGRLRYQACESADLPLAGDWVALLGDEVSRMIHAILPRSSLLQRKRPGLDTAQPMIANLDGLVIVSAIDEHLSFELVERFLAMAAGGGLRTLLVFSKADLCSGLSELQHETSLRFNSHDCLFTSSFDSNTRTVLESRLQPGESWGFVGRSGAGKSTLINLLLDTPILRTAEVRSDDSKGRHTTTSRQFMLSHSGIILADTPGLREAGIWVATDSVDAAFGEIAALARDCRFGDCTHTGEPDCAVLLALEEGRLQGAVYNNYLKCRREAAAFENTDRWKQIHKEVRRFYKNSPKYNQ